MRPWFVIGLRIWMSLLAVLLADATWAIVSNNPGFLLTRAGLAGFGLTLVVIPVCIGLWADTVWAWIAVWLIHAVLLIARLFGLYQQWFDLTIMEIPLLVVCTSVVGLHFLPWAVEFEQLPGFIAANMGGEKKAFLLVVSLILISVSLFRPVDKPFFANRTAPVRQHSSPDDVIREPNKALENARSFPKYYRGW